MRVILDSNILYQSELLRENLSRKLSELLRACAKRGDVIVLPRTTVLEVKRQQEKAAESARSKLETAYEVLTRFGIRYDRVEAGEAVKPGDLVGLIQGYGVTVQVEEPTMEDLREAHDRACLHECPHPPEATSDEMRDLVVWMTALRLAKEGGALLISGDRVHAHPRGDGEASTVGLVRVKTVEEALEYFDVRTPAGELVEQLLAPGWEDLIRAGLPLTRHVSVVGISGARFVQGVRGPSFAACRLKARTADGKTLKTAAEIHVAEGAVQKIRLSGIIVDDRRWDKDELTIAVNKKVEVEEKDYEERLRGLKEALGEEIWT